MKATISAYVSEVLARAAAGPSVEWPVAVGNRFYHLSGSKIAHVQPLGGELEEAVPRWCPGIHVVHRAVWPIRRSQAAGGVGIFLYEADPAPEIPEKWEHPVPLTKTDFNNARRIAERLLLAAEAFGEAVMVEDAAPLVRLLDSAQEPFFGWARLKPVDL